MQLSYDYIRNKLSWSLIRYQLKFFTNVILALHGPNTALILLRKPETHYPGTTIRCDATLYDATNRCLLGTPEGASTLLSTCRSTLLINMSYNQYGWYVDTSHATFFCWLTCQINPHFVGLIKECRLTNCSLNICRSTLMVYADFFDIFLHRVNEFPAKQYKKVPSKEKLPSLETIMKNMRYQRNWTKRLMSEKNFQVCKLV